MTDLLTAQELADLHEIQVLMDAGYDHYFANSDGYCKSSEGWFSIDFGNYFDRRDGRRVRRIEVYSYVLGPHRTHDFQSTAEAIETVREWHAAEMATDYSEDPWNEGA